MIRLLTLPHVKCQKQISRHSTLGQVTQILKCERNGGSSAARTQFQSVWQTDPCLRKFLPSWCREEGGEQLSDIKGARSSPERPFFMPPRRMAHGEWERGREGVHTTHCLWLHAVAAEGRIWGLPKWYYSPHGHKQGSSRQTLELENARMCHFERGKSGNCYGRRPTAKPHLLLLRLAPASLSLQ